jgi:hypothetical protein
MSCGQELAVREFALSYRRAATMQVSLALVGLVLGLVAAWQLRDAWIATGTVLHVASIPFTLPDDGTGDGRRREGVKRMQAIARNCRNQWLRC